MPPNTKKIVLVGPRTVARHLTEDDPRNNFEELVKEIGEDPELYYEEYVWTCEVLKVDPVPLDFWRDICRWPSLN
jgi:hypothetical protein